MGYAFVACGRMRIKGNDAIDSVVPHLRKAGHVQLNLELAKMDIVQLDRLGCYGQQIAFGVIRQSVELLIRLDEFLVNLGDRGHLDVACLDSLLDLLDVIGNVSKGCFDLREHLLASSLPIANLTEVQLSANGYKTAHLLDEASCSVSVSGVDREYGSRFVSVVVETSSYSILSHK